MDTVGSIVTDIGAALLQPAQHHAQYLFCSKQNVKKLKSKVDELGVLKNDIQGRLNIARRKGEVIRNEVLRWVSSVDAVEAAFARLDDGAKHGCFMCLSLNCSTAYNLGKKAAKEMAHVVRLQTEGRNFSSISDHPPPLTIDSWPTRDIDAFASQESTIMEIVMALEAENINIVGVFGMGGVGKTTLMKEMGKRLKREKVFDEVVMVTVTLEPNIRRIQNDIADQLGQELAQVKIESIRAGRLSATLKQENKILIILDDMWERLELADIGIPYGDDHKGCKMVVMTRNSDICNLMGCQKAIAISVLPEDESWHLFKKNAGDIVDSPQLNMVAKDIVKECGGLPLAIVTLGRALCNKDKATWTDALLQLKKSNPENIEDMDTKVFASLKLSYNFLGNEKIKSFFLFCCLFPQDHSIEIDMLVRYGVGDDLWDGVDTLKQARDRVQSWIDKLKASCLLMDGDEKGCVKMHDVVRNVAIGIAKKKHGFLVQPGLSLTNWPESMSGKCKKISLLHNRITALSCQPRCSRLETLLLQRNYSLKNITDTFFEGMKGLKVLDLSSTDIAYLPQSSRCLTNLKTLCLDGCLWLEDVSLIGGLTELEILSLASSGIRELPTEIGELTHLKLLDLTGTAFLERIPPNVLSRLTFLEELRMEGSFSGWEVEGNCNGNNASFRELSSLAHLTDLYIQVRNADCLFENISAGWKCLKSFCISVGDDNSGSGDPIFQISVGHTCSYSEHPNRTVLENIGNRVSNWVKGLLSGVRDLYLVCCKDLRSLLHLESHGFNSLEVLRIFKCNEMEHLISSTEAGSILPNALENLEKLIIHRTDNLKMFCEGPIPSGFLGKLRVLDVSNCKNFITMLPTELMQRMKCLEKLKVRDCLELVEVFHFEGIVGEDSSIRPLSRLKEMKLKHLPKLARLWKGAVLPQSLNNLEELRIEKCMSLRCLFSTALVQNLQKLEALWIGDCNDLQNIISSDDRVPNLSASTNGSPRGANLPLPPTFRNLRGMYISSCNGLKRLMPASLAHGLPQLEQLQVLYCDGMEAMIAEDENEAITVGGPIFPRLKNLQLVSLPRLKTLYQWEVLLFLDWPSLVRIEVHECPELKWLCMGPQSALGLQEIIGEREWFQGLEWGVEGRVANLRLQPLFRVHQGPAIVRMPSKPMIPTSSMGAKWNYEHDGFFIELMTRQVSRRLKGQWWDEWRNILRELNKRFGVRFQLQELRSHQNWLKKHYFICKSLLSHSGFSWDDVLHKVTADGQAWDEYTKPGTSSTSLRASQEMMVARGQINPNEDINRKSYISRDKEDLNEFISIKGNTKANFSNSMSRTSPTTDTLLPPNPTDSMTNFLRCMQELKKLATELTLEEISQAASLLKEEKNAIAFLTFSGPLRLCFIRSLLK
ncbi:hypothetical protein ACLOJK_028003 [Asimina triloba]